MAAIYDKALKRIYLAGVVNKENDANKGADIGKIVNLMSGDVGQVCHTCTQSAVSCV